MFTLHYIRLLKNYFCKKVSVIPSNIIYAMHLLTLRSYFLSVYFIKSNMFKVRRWGVSAYQIVSFSVLLTKLTSQLVQEKERLIRG